MTVAYEDSSSIPEKLTLLTFIAAVITGNICVFITFIVRGNGKHWSNIFVLGMALIDLFIGSFVLPIRFLSAYGSPLTSQLCTALMIGESSALACVIYTIAFMIYTRLYDLKARFTSIRRRYLIAVLLITWLVLFLFYAIPFMVSFPNYLVTVISSTTNTTTSYCTTYTTSICHPPWMSYTEIGLIYSVPLSAIGVGLSCLMIHLCQRRPRGLDAIERKHYRERQQMTRHVTILTIAFLILWLPWIIIRILIIFQNTKEIQQALQITYYILIFKSVLFPILYASTNSAFRGSFAMYRHKRIIMTNRVWTVNEHAR